MADTDISLPQVYPFCYWVAVIIDHLSRTCIGFSVFKKQPTSEQVTDFLDTAIKRTKKKPKYIITDKGRQFWKSRNYKAWLKQHKIKPRFGAVGKYGSISIVERFIKTLKNECTRKIMVPLNVNEMKNSITYYINWYNQYRPHESLKGRTPFEEYFQKQKRNKRYKVKGTDIDKLKLLISYLEGQKHLPIIKLRKVA